MSTDPNEILKKASAVLGSMSEEKQKEKNRLDSERNTLIIGIGQNIADLMRPIMERIARMARLSKDDIKEAISELNITVPPPVIPPIQVPRITVPTPQVTVRVPEIKVPEQKQVELVDHSITYKKPLPVILTDENGKPYIAGTMGGGGYTGSKYRFQGVDSAGVYRTALVDEGGRLQVDVVDLLGDVAQGSGVVNSDTLRVVHVTDVATSVNVTSFTASVQTHLATPAGDSVIDEGFDAARVISAAQGTELGDGVLRVYQVANAVSSVNVTGFTSSVQTHLATPAGDSVIDEGFDAARVISAAQGTELGDGVLRIYHVANAVSSTNLVNINSLATGFGSGVDNTGVLRVVHVTDVAASVRAILNDGVDIGDVTINGATSTIMAVGDIVSGGADNESAPLKVGGIARTANPTAVSAGNRVSATFDKLGRQVVWPYQVRDLIATARASLTTGTETTLLAGVASTFHDLVYVAASNSSTGTVTVDLRSATAAGIVLTLDVPANGVTGVAPVVPIPQDIAADTWTADMGDVTNTTVQVSALFVKNV